MIIMLTHDHVNQWLEAYVAAWKSYDPAAIGALFSDDAVYVYTPFDEPLRGRAAIVQSWLDNADEPNTYDASYQPVVIEGNTAVTNGRSRYFEPDSKTLRAQFDNVFILRFNGAGQCVEFREWYMQERR